MRTIILFLLAWLLCSSAGHAQQLTAAEYFLDTDPGVGAGHPISVATGNVVNANYAVNTTGIPVGFHTLSTRFKDVAGTWGIAASRLFYVYGVSGGGITPAPSLSAGEYFIDVDPGAGHGQSFAIAPGAQASVAFAVDAGTLPVGFHTLSMRFKDAANTWGLTQARLFYIYGSGGGSSTPASPIAAAEYFFDADPGVGNGTALSTGMPQDNVSVNTVIDASTVAVGTHVLTIRLKDADGRWGIADSRPFVVLPPGAVVNDECLGAIVLPLHAFGECPGQATPGTTQTATSSGVTSCLGNGRKDLWYQVNSANAPQITIDITEVSAQGVYVEVLDGCGGNVLDCLNSFPATLSTSLNTTYVLRVYTSIANGSFGICVSMPALDCMNVPGGPDMPGSACDDGNPLTPQTYWSSTCTCTDYYDCLGQLNGPTLPGTPCDVAYAGDGYGVYDANCSCTWTDCEGTVNGFALPYYNCDDGNPNTTGEYWQPDCTCGQGYDCEGVVGGTAVPGTPCDVVLGGDGYGVFDASCSCTWTDCEGTVNGFALPYYNCDDGNPNTTGEYWQPDCTCGQGYDCAGVVGGTALPGTECEVSGNIVGTYDPNCMCNWTDCAGTANGYAFPGTYCDDGNPNTIGEVWQPNCTCGDGADCNGDFGGTAFLDNCGSCVGGNTGVQPCIVDCNGVQGGSAFVDNCNVCAGGNTGIAPCAADCNGVFGGTASLDNCGTCTGGNTGIAPCAADCYGDFGGTASLDNCGTCSGGNTGITPCATDCNGVFGGTASLDNCGTCTGGNTGITPCAADCNGVFGGTASLDNCGTCTGGNTGIAPCAADCNGVFGGTASLDNCGTCTGGNTGITPCVADCNGVFGGTASLDNCGTCTGGNTGIAPCVADCNGDFGGTALPGSACDDLDACTTGDVYDANCLCAGTFADADGDGTCDAQDLCANGPEPGTACDDGDTNTVNDVIDANCTCTGYPVSTCDEEKLVLSITLDNFGSQTTWEIRTADEAFVVASGGPYADGQAGTTISETMCVDHGCYKLRVHDANGDGILNGGYVLRDGNSNRIIDANGNFTYVSYLGRKFCLPVSATTLLANSCDLVNVINTDMVQCTTVAGASAYQFWIFDPHGNNEWGFTRTNPVLGPAPLAMIPPGLNLNVRVRAVVNGSNRPFGPACRISTAGVPEFQQHVARDIDESKGEFQAWPNPNNGDRLSISLTGADADAENADVVLYDATGRKVFATSLAMANGMLGTELELGNLGTGVYMLRITAGGQSYESRVSVVNH